MGEDIRLTASDGHEFDAYKAVPEGAPRAGLVVLQEIFGVNSHIRAVCDRYATAGYLAIAPAIFDRAERDVLLGYDAEGVEQGRALRDKIKLAEVIEDVSATADAAAAGGKVGIVGYCWGGFLVYVAACRLGSKFAAASGYYGGNIKSVLDETPVVPLQLHFGALDTGIPLDEVALIGKTYPRVAVHIYEGADHGFNCDHRPKYHAQAAKLAEERTLALLETQLA